MTGWLIALPAALAYLIIARIVARRWYDHIRLLAAPLSCQSPGDKYHAHYERCYRQRPNQLIESNHEAAFYAALVGLCWPSMALIWLFMCGSWLVIAGGKPRLRPAEMQARITELERELGLRPSAVREMDEQLNDAARERPAQQ